MSVFRNIFRSQIKWDKKEKKQRCIHWNQRSNGKFFIAWHWETGFSPKEVFPLNDINHFSSASPHDDWKRSNLTPVIFLSLWVFLKSCLAELSHWQTLTSLRGEGGEQGGQKNKGWWGTPWINKPLKSCPSFYSLTPENNSVYTSI